MKPKPRRRFTIEERIDFVMRMGNALHRYGIAAHRLEQSMENLSASLGLKVHVFSTPTAIMASFGTPRGEQQRLLRVQPGDLDLEKLCEVDELGDAVAEGRCTVTEGVLRLKEVDARATRYPWSLTVLSFGAASASVSVFLGAVKWSIAVSAAIGLMIGLIVMFAAWFPRWSRVYDAAAALFAAFAGAWAGSQVPGVVSQLVVISGLIVLVPGLALTIAMAELATQNLVSGTARIMGAVTVLLKLTFGVLVGGKIAEHLGWSSGVAGVEFVVPSWETLPALGVTALALTVLFRARPRDFVWVLAAGTVGIVATRATGPLLGSELAAFSGGWAIGVASNLFSRVLNRPASVMLLPGIILLVPGSIGFRSFGMMEGPDVVTGVSLLFQMLVVAIALVAGLFFANVTVTPRRSL